MAYNKKAVQAVLARAKRNGSFHTIFVSVHTRLRKRRLSSQALGIAQRAVLAPPPLSGSSLLISHAFSSMPRKEKLVFEEVSDEVEVAAGIFVRFKVYKSGIVQPLGGGSPFKNFTLKRGQSAADAKVTIAALFSGSAAGMIRPDQQITARGNVTDLCA